MMVHIDVALGGCKQSTPVFRLGFDHRFAELVNLVCAIELLKTRDGHVEIVADFIRFGPVGIESQAFEDLIGILVVAIVEGLLGIGPRHGDSFPSHGKCETT